eukprot:1425354-Prorocentrum_lima.AAC.1
MTSSLVGSEMCIRDSPMGLAPRRRDVCLFKRTQQVICPVFQPQRQAKSCLLYTSDAADDM